MEILKKCPRCKKVLPLEFFADNTRHCKICRRDYDWQYRYGLSPEQYLELYTRQEGRCAICGKELKEGEYLCVDHDHRTGDVRGLLCNSCNKGLACFKDNPIYLSKSLIYLGGGLVENSNN